SNVFFSLTSDYWSFCLSSSPISKDLSFFNYLFNLPQKIIHLGYKGQVAINLVQLEIQKNNFKSANAIAIKNLDHVKNFLKDMLLKHIVPWLILNSC
ncbi:hypothetical protein, partial [Lactobacillus helveticus]